MFAYFHTVEKLDSTVPEVMISLVKKLRIVHTLSASSHYTDDHDIGILQPFASFHDFNHHYGWSAGSQCATDGQLTLAHSVIDVLGQ